MNCTSESSSITYVLFHFTGRLNLQRLNTGRNLGCRQITGRTVVEPAHMELADPSILQAVGACAARGSKKVIIAPYFLSKGKHIQQDIPALVQEAQAVYPEVECVIAEPLGVDPLLVAIIDSRVKTASQNDFVAC